MLSSDFNLIIDQDDFIEEFIYDFLDNIFLKVLRNNSSDMGEIFFKMFNSSPKTAINFLSNKSNFLEDLEIILKMPKWKFFKELF